MLPESAASAAMAKVASEVIERASKPILGLIAERLSKEAMKVRVQFTKTFQNHLARAFEKAHTVKTVTSRDKPVDLEAIYVPLTLASAGQKGLADIEADPSSCSGARFVLSGTGGAGKTFLMKHLLNISKLNGKGLVPLFVELRSIEFDSGRSLEDCIFHELRAVGGSESRELFQIALDEGLFVIYLDGFDEIHPEESAQALRLIKRFSERYKSTSMLITTRPRTGVETLHGFRVFHVQPLNKDQALELIRRTEFDQATKQKFLEAMAGGLYDKHQTLMSLPILVAMMLLTYRTYADIPDRMTVFYSQAFETLYSIHDAENKELFKREHHAGLAPDVFKRVLQAFSYLSLSNHDIEFSESLLTAYITRALKVARVNVDPAAYKDDLIHNVCVLQPEGLNYVFVHRSFQEFFAAQFALNFSGENKFKVIDRIIGVSGSAVAGMMSEIDELKLKRDWVLPRLDILIEDLNGRRRRKSPNLLGSLFSPVFVISGHASFAISRENSGFHAAEVLAAILNRNISMPTLVKGLKFPLERELLMKFPDVKKVREGSSGLKLVYDNDHTYEIRASEAQVIDESGFLKNFEEYVAILRRERTILARWLDEYKALEDDELFS